MNRRTLWIITLILLSILCFYVLCVALYEAVTVREILDLGIWKILLLLIVSVIPILYPLYRMRKKKNK